MTVKNNWQTRVWSFEGFRRDLGQTPLIMGIVNVTPDSFSDGGQFLDHQSAVDQALKLVAEGADILDVGGESTRPGADEVPLDEELRRVIPVIQQLSCATSIPISVDTSKAEVARQALRAGAKIVNATPAWIASARLTAVNTPTPRRAVASVAAEAGGNPLESDPGSDPGPVTVSDPGPDPAAEP